MVELIKNSEVLIFHIVVVVLVVVAVIIIIIIFLYLLSHILIYFDPN